MILTKTGTINQKVSSKFYHFFCNAFGTFTPNMKSLAKFYV